jgi:HK97 gp10 family phage protein
MTDGELLGVEELKLSLRELPKNVADKHMRKALRAGAKIIQSQCISDAPERSGKTAAAIKVRAGKRKKNSVSMMVTLSKAMFPTGLFYVGFINYGWKWKPHSSKKGVADNTTASEHKIPGTRWLNKAFAKAKDAAHEAIVAVLKAGLAEEAAKAKGGGR